ncbi:hypothetical protein CDL15_Pgr011479 [Punica granatum]|uniref:Uncharacterized protein n=1 Tax=Punica granatum TaxID=22663 RepID=A0A218WG65_PUNGR|nr:hypothetical protein CDL15_Pgr011479 [Punica granatum]
MNWEIRDGSRTPTDLLSIGAEQWCQRREIETSRLTVRGSRVRGSRGRVEVAVEGSRVAARGFVFGWARGSRGRVEVAVEGSRVAARGFVFVWSAGLSRGLRLVKMKDEGGRVKVETGWKLKPTASEISKLGLT